MDKAFITVMSILIAAYIVVLVVTINHNSSYWCADPISNGNALINPLCK